METVIVSKCCGAPIKDSEVNGEYTTECNKCGQTCFTIEVCEYCLGRGEVDRDEDDGYGNIMVGVGTEKCMCTVHIHDGDGDDD